MMTKLDSKRKEYFEVTFQPQELQGKNFEGITFEQCCFNQCDLNHSQFIQCRFIDCEFYFCNLNFINIKNTSFSGVVFNDSNMMAINWSSAKWPQIKLVSPIHFYQCNISHSSFFGLSLIEAIIEPCKAHEVDFRECDLSNANLVHSDFYKSFFVHTNLSYADFTEATNYCIDINLNKIHKAKFTFPEVVGLLTALDIEILGMERI